MNRYKSLLLLFALAVVSMCTVSCSKSKSYSELLRSEEKAVNWFMAGQRIVTSVPEDSVFEVGPDAPYYRMDDDGYIYMQVLNAGDKKNMAKKDQLIYFRYMRTNIQDMYEGKNPVPTGNANSVGAGNSTSFRFDNSELPSTIQYGNGIQVPLKYLGIDCEVNIVIRSYYGFLQETGQCQPFLYHVRYFSSKL